MIAEYLTSFQYETLLYAAGSIFAFGIIIVSCMALAKHYSAEGSIMRYIWTFSMICTLLVVLPIASVIGFYGYQGYDKASVIAAKAKLYEENANKNKLPAEMAILESDDSDEKDKKIEYYDDTALEQQPMYSEEEMKEFYSLGTTLKTVELRLKEQIDEDNASVKQIDADFKAGKMSTYDQLLSKARQEQVKRQHIVDAMNEKISMIETADFLTKEEKQEALFGNLQRRDSAERELAQYQEVERLLIERKGDYENL